MHNVPQPSSTHISWVFLLCLLKLGTNYTTLAQPLTTTILLSAFSVKLTTLGASQKWNPIVFTLCNLIISLSVIPFYGFIYKIPFYVYVMLFPLINQWIMAGFLFLTVMKHVTMNQMWKRLLKSLVSFTLCVHPQMELANYTVSVCLIWGFITTPSHLFLLQLCLFLAQGTSASNSLQTSSNNILSSLTLSSSLP